MGTMLPRAPASRYVRRGRVRSNAQRHRPRNIASSATAAAAVKAAANYCAADARGSTCRPCRFGRQIPQRCACEDGGLSYVYA